MVNQDVQIKSTLDSINHIKQVQFFMEQVIKGLIERARLHDASKLNEPEYSGYAGLSEALKGLQYGTDEYRAAFVPFRAIIQHHYQANDHHPEHFDKTDGVAQMNLLQLVEMFCDWKAASTRNGSSLLDSLDVSVQRFGVEPQLAKIFTNTARDLDW